MNQSNWKRVVHASANSLWSSFRDLLPIIVVVLTFQVFVFRQWPENVGQLLGGTLLVTIGLSLFISGLQLALFPIGEGMANDFARKGSLAWLIAFAFCLGFGTSFAEPALIAVGNKAAELRYPASLDSSDQKDPAESANVIGSAISDIERKRANYAFTLRTTAATAVGIALIIGVLRIIKGWPIQYIITIGYVLVILVTPFAPSNIIAIAYDSGGVTTSTITVPLTAALGVGLASSIRGRNPVTDGFGLIALAALAPILFVLLLGMMWQ